MSDDDRNFIGTLCYFIYGTTEYPTNDPAEKVSYSLNLRAAGKSYKNQP